MEDTVCQAIDSEIAAYRAALTAIVAMCQFAKPFSALGCFGSLAQGALDAGDRIRNQGDDANQKEEKL